LYQLYSPHTGMSHLKIIKSRAAVLSVFVLAAHLGIRFSFAP